MCLLQLMCGGHRQVPWVGSFHGEFQIQLCQAWQQVSVPTQPSCWPREWGSANNGFWIPAVNGFCSSLIWNGPVVDSVDHSTICYCSEQSYAYLMCCLVSPSLRGTRQSWGAGTSVWPLKARFIMWFVLTHWNFYFMFWDRVLLSSSGCHGTHCYLGWPQTQ